MSFSSTTSTEPQCFMVSSPGVSENLSLENLVVADIAHGALQQVMPKPVENGDSVWKRSLNEVKESSNQYLTKVARRERVLLTAQKNILSLSELPLDKPLVDSMEPTISSKDQRIKPLVVRDVEANLGYEKFFSFLSRDDRFEEMLKSHYEGVQLWDDRPAEYSKKSRDTSAIVEALLDPEDRSLVNPLQLETLSFPLDNRMVKDRFTRACSYLYPRELVRLMEKPEASKEPVVRPLVLPDYPPSMRPLTLPDYPPSMRSLTLPDQPPSIRPLSVPKTPSMTSTFIKLALAGKQLNAESAGQGGCGEVSRINVEGKDYAQKLAKPHIDKRIMDQEIFANLHVAQDLEAPTVQMVAAFKEGFVMEYIEGSKDFLTLFENGSIPSDHQVIKAIRAIVDGLKHLESKGFCHRDIKFENCILTSSGDVKLMDFGFAQRIGSLMRNSAGTERYLAPEVKKLKKGDVNSIKADIYALGVCISGYRMHRKDRNAKIGDLLFNMESKCRTQSPLERPSLEEVEKFVRAIEEELSHPQDK